MPTSNVIPMAKAKASNPPLNKLTTWQEAIRFELGGLYLTGWNLKIDGGQKAKAIRKKVKQIEAEYGQALPTGNTVAPGSDTARALTAAYQRCYFRENPGAAEKLLAAQRAQLTENQQGRFDKTLARAMDTARAEWAVQLKKAVDARVHEVHEAQHARWKELDDQARELDRREANITGLMTPEQYKLVKGCLHPDRLTSIDPDRLHKAFQLFSELETNVPPWAKPKEWKK